VLGEADEFRKLRRAIDKAHGDRDQAVRNVCRLYSVKTVEALPGAIRAATLATARSVRLCVPPSDWKLLADLSSILPAVRMRTRLSWRETIDDRRGDRADRVRGGFL
jgi:hypothetical protein